MAIFDFWLSRNNGASLETYIGNKDRLFFDPASGGIRLSDGVTPGGLPIPITIATATAPGGVKPGVALSVNEEGTIGVNTGPMFTADGSNNLQLLAATETAIGGVRLGPGVTTNVDGQIIIDSQGLDFSFGDFAATVNTYPVGHPRAGDDYAVLQTINANEDAVFASNGTGSIKVVGEFEIYKPDNGLNDALLEQPFFKVQTDGQITILVSDVDPIAGAVKIIGNDTGISLSPAVEGVMLHITGQNDLFASQYIDGVNNYPNYIGRRYNGTTVSPTQVLNGQTIVRFSGQGYSTGGFNPPADGTISLDALEDFTETNQGAVWRFLVNPVGGNVRQEVASMSVANGVTATKFTGPLDGNADTATTATDLAAASSILAGTITVDPANINRTTASTQTFTLTGLTTNHKIVVTSGTAIGFGIVIAAAWASAADTLSIEFHNYTGNQDIDLGAKTIQYFAWV